MFRFRRAALPIPFEHSQYFLYDHWDLSLPVDPAAIARHAGVKVVGESLGSLSGKLEFEGTPGRPVISYNVDMPEMSQRFAIAHALGHYVLEHGTQFHDTPESFVRLHYDPLEIAANRFATEILMPAIVVRGLLRHMRKTDVDALLETFNVSDTLLEFRFKRLGWL